MSITNVFINRSYPFLNTIIRKGSIDLLILLLLFWEITSHLFHGSYSNVIELFSDIRIRSNVLIFFYYALSRLSFRYCHKTSFVVTILLLFLFSLKEAILGITQLCKGAPFPVGTMMNPNIFACLLSISCSVLIIIVSKQTKRALRVIGYTILCLFLFLVLQSKSRLALLSIVVPTICFLVITSNYSHFFRKHIASISFVLILLFSVLYVIKKPSADGRFYMSKIAIRTICHNGIWGCGVDSYAGAFGDEQFSYYCNGKEEVDIDYVISSNLKNNNRACTPMTAFNEILRIGVEFGPVAMLLALYIIIRAIIILIKKVSPLGYGLFSLFLVSQFSYPHCFPIYCLLLSIFIGAASSLDNCDSKKWISWTPPIVNSFEVLLLGSFLLLELPQIRVIEDYNKHNEDITFLFKNEEYKMVSEYCKEFFDSGVSNLSLLYEYGVSLSKLGYYEKSDSILHVGAALCSNPVFWQEIGHNYFRDKKYVEAEKAYIRSFMMVPNRITPLLYLAQLYYQIDDKEKLSKISLFSDEFKPKIPSATTIEYHNIIKRLANGE